MASGGFFDLLEEKNGRDGGAEDEEEEAEPVEGGAGFGGERRQGARIVERRGRGSQRELLVVDRHWRNGFSFQIELRSRFFPPFHPPQSLRVTPAMQAGLTTKLWEIEHLLALLD